MQNFMQITIVNYKLSEIISLKPSDIFFPSIMDNECEFQLKFTNPPTLREIIF